MTGRQIVVRRAQFLEAHKQAFGDASYRMPTNPSLIRTALCLQAVAVRISRPSSIIHRASLSMHPSPSVLVHEDGARGVAKCRKFRSENRNRGMA